MVSKMRSFRICDFYVIRRCMSLIHCMNKKFYNKQISPKRKMLNNFFYERYSHMVDLFTSISYNRNAQKSSFLIFSITIQNNVNIGVGMAQSI